MSLFSQTNPIRTPAAATKQSITGQLKQLKHKNQLLTILVLLLVCVFSWGIASIFSSQRQSKLPSDLTKLAKPLNPNLDTQILNTLETKRSFTAEELSQIEIFIIVVDPATQTEQIIEINESVKAVATPTPRPRATSAPTPTAQPAL